MTTSLVVRTRELVDASRIQPQGGRVLVEPIVETMTAGGLVLPQVVAERKCQRAKVVAVGQGRNLLKHSLRIEQPCQVGDIVYYSPWGQTKIQVANKEYLLIGTDEILAVELREGENAPCPVVCPYGFVHLGDGQWAYYDKRDPSGKAWVLDERACFTGECREAPRRVADSQPAASQRDRSGAGAEVVEPRTSL